MWSGLQNKMLERLQKIIARAGIASRRHAEELIRSGQVRVNGVVVTELGAKADPERDRVEAAGRVAERPSEPTYLVLNKPIHVVSTMSDPEGRATLRHVLRGLAGGIFPVGRLDYAASGLMLLTSDGELADRIFKNSARLPQVYWLKVAGRLSEDEMQQVPARRMRACGGCALRRRGSEPANPWYEVELNDTRRDLLRRALFSPGHPVEKMKRVKLGPLELAISRTAITGSSSREKSRNCADSRAPKSPAPRDAQKARDSPRTRSQKKTRLLPNDRLGPGTSSFRSADQRASAEGAHDRGGGPSSSRFRASYGVSQYMQSPATASFP